MQRFQVVPMIFARHVILLAAQDDSRCEFIGVPFSLSGTRLCRSNLTWSVIDLQRDNGPEQRQSVDRCAIRSS